MKNTNKKGFTLVELVIVIAVIAILAAVLIPTFTSIINRANQSAAVQKLKAALDEDYIDYVADEKDVPTKLYKKDDVFTFTNPTSADAVYALIKDANNDGDFADQGDYTKSYVLLDEKYDVYLLWEAGKGYSVVTSATTPTEYTEAVAP